MKKQNYQRQREKDLREADKEFKGLTRHLNTKLDVDSEALAQILDRLTDSQKKLIQKAQQEYIDNADTDGFYIRFQLDDVRGLWGELSDEQRIEVIKSLIWCAPDAQGFYQKVMRVIGNEIFEGAID
jgi:hypothetical protein